MPGRTRSTRFLSPTLRAMVPVLCLGAAASCFAAESNALAQTRAEQILEATGVRGGLVVHLGCGDGRLAGDIGTRGPYLVHALDTDAAHVAKARVHVRERGLYGKVSVERFTGKRLPYVDSLVNLIVASDLGNVPQAEAMRVLAPEGVLCVVDGGSPKKTVKPRPDEIDEWTPYLYDATNNAVAADLEVGPPHHLRWWAGPHYCRSHEFNPAENGYELFADANDNEPVLPSRSADQEKGPGYQRANPPKWSAQVPVRARAMVLAGHCLFFAGPPDVVPANDPYAAFEGRLGAKLWTVSAKDGKKLAEISLDAVPVFDGMAAANGRLYLATKDGKVLCMKGRR